MSSLEEAADTEKYGPVDAAEVVGEELDEGVEESDPALEYPESLLEYFGAVTTRHNGSAVAGTFWATSGTYVVNALLWLSGGLPCSSWSGILRAGLVECTVVARIQDESAPSRGGAQEEFVGSKRRFSVRSIGAEGTRVSQVLGGGREKARGCVVASVRVPDFPLNKPFRTVLLLENTY